MRFARTPILVAVLVLLAGCAVPDAPAPTGAEDDAMQSLVAKYTSFELTADLGGLTDNQRRMLPLLIEAGQAMDEAFWMQAYGDRQGLLDSIGDPAARRFAEINYGPWDRLDADASFIEGIGPKPKGANLYPVDMTVEEFEAAAAESAAREAELRSEYTVIRRGEDGALIAQPYSEAYAPQIEVAAAKLEQAAELADEAGLKRYLELRAEALRSNDYRPSDMAWMEMKDNVIDVVVGPVEHYEDKLFGYKTAFTTYVLLKDLEWSGRLARYASMLPDLQRGLPVPDAYKSESPGSNSDLNAYDVVYYAGDCNAGSKTIAINLPNDETVQAEKGSRRLQLKNAMRAKFDKILLPIADVVIAEDQRAHVTFDAFFANTMFHEVAHGLGIKETLDGSGSVREALKDEAGALEEGKADILGLYMVTKLHEQGELGDAPLEDYYVTFLAGIFRSSRFGASSAHGRANMARFDFFSEMGAFTRDETNGHYRADFQQMRAAIDALSEKILRLQGDGDYAGVQVWMAEAGVVGAGFQQDLDRINEAGVPVDVIFEQGVASLGL